MDLQNLKSFGSLLMRILLFRWGVFNIHFLNQIFYVLMKYLPISINEAGWTRLQT